MLRHADVISAAMLIAMSACQFHASCGKKGVTKSKTQKEIKEALATLGVTQVSCPELKVDTTVTCTAKTNDGRSYNVQVIVDPSNVRWETSEILKGDKVASDIVRAFTDRFQVANVRCPKLIAKDVVTRCEATVNGAAARVKVDMQSKPEYVLEKPGASGSAPPKPPAE